MNRVQRTDAVINQRDSSSMKVIAIMTMAFLPATFFATLFAVPSLSWNENAPVVVKSNFWVYVAFALPTTAIVFVVWAVCTRRFIWRKAEKGEKPSDV